MRSELSDQDQIFPPLTILFLLLFTLLVSGFLGAGAIFGLAYLQGSPYEDIVAQLSFSTSRNARDLMRVFISINHLSTFILPPLFVAILLYRRAWAPFLSLHRRPATIDLALGTLLIVVAMPLAQLTYWLNQQLPLPDWMIDMEDSTNDLLKNLLISNRPYELLFNLLVVAILPALGEEMVFRGVLQKQLARWAGRGHLAIWLAATIFSAFHLQFEGFIPRLLLGALLGYLLYWTKNLWVPIFAHFINNAVQVIALYLYQHEWTSYNPDETEEVSWGLSIFSLILLLLIGSRLYGRYRSRYAQTEPPDTAGE
ncbi:MAG: type II CAAX endopeptidase family protein [Bacteroidota bacterium]